MTEMNQNHEPVVGATHPKSDDAHQRSDLMDPIVLTPRLKMTLITKAERGSPESEWLHELHSNEKTTWWSIYGQSKSIEDTEKITKHYLPTDNTNPETHTYRVVYAVHKLLPTPTNSSVENETVPASTPSETPSELIGLVYLKSLDAGSLTLPVHLTFSPSAAATTLTLELAYMFLPTAWGVGYAPESLNAAFEACRRARGFWSPFENVYVSVLVNEQNGASRRVMEKVGMGERGVYEWTGERIWLAGEWRVQVRLCVFGMGLWG